MNTNLDKNSPRDFIRTYGRMTCWNVPKHIDDEELRNPSPEFLKKFRKERASWEIAATENITTYFGKDYVWRFITKAVDPDTSIPFFTTGTADSDDYLTYLAIGTGGTSAPDPNAFKLNSDNIQQYRGRGRIIQSISVDPADAPHAVEVAATVLGVDLRPALGATDSYSINEAALVPLSSDDHTGTYPGNKVTAYCTFTSVPVTVNDRWIWTWILGVA